MQNQWHHNSSVCAATHHLQFGLWQRWSQHEAWLSYLKKSSSRDIKKLRRCWVLSFSYLAAAYPTPSTHSSFRWGWGQQILLHKVMWCNNHVFLMKAQQKFKKTFQCQDPKLSCILCLVVQQCPGTATKCGHSFLGLQRIATLSIPMLSLCFWDEKQSWSIEEFMQRSMSLWSSSEDWEDEEGIVTNVGKIDIFGVRRGGFF